MFLIKPLLLVWLFVGCFKWKIMGCFRCGSKDKQSNETLTLTGRSAASKEYLDDSYVSSNDDIPDLSKITDKNAGSNTFKNTKGNTIEQVIHRGYISQRRNSAKHFSYPPSYQHRTETNRDGRVVLSLQRFYGESTNCFNMRGSLVHGITNNSNVQLKSGDNRSEKKEIKHGQLSGSYGIYDEDDSPIYHIFGASDRAVGQNVNSFLNCHQINGCIKNSFFSTTNSNTNIEYENLVPSPKSKRQLEYAVISNLSRSPDCHSSKLIPISPVCKGPRSLTKDFDITDYTSIDETRTRAIRSASLQQRR